MPVVLHLKHPNYNTISTKILDLCNALSFSSPAEGGKKHVQTLDRYLPGSGQPTGPGKIILFHFRLPAIPAEKAASPGYGVQDQGYVPDLGEKVLVDK